MISSDHTEDGHSNGFCSLLLHGNYPHESIMLMLGHQIVARHSAPCLSKQKKPTS